MPQSRFRCAEMIANFIDFLELAHHFFGEVVGFVALVQLEVGYASLEMVLNQA